MLKKKKYYVNTYNLHFIFYLRKITHHHMSRKTSTAGHGPPPITPTNNDLAQPGSNGFLLTLQDHQSTLRVPYPVPLLHFLLFLFTLFKLN